MSVRSVHVPFPASVTPRRAPMAVYARRRLTVVVVILAIVVGSVLLARAASVAVASRGGVPASATAAPTDAASAVAAGAYVARPGDTLWGIARRFHGAADLGWYVDELVEVNGSASIEVGQLVLLP